MIMGLVTVKVKATRLQFGNRKILPPLEISDLWRPWNTKSQCMLSFPDELNVCFLFVFHFIIVGGASPSSHFPPENRIMNKALLQINLYKISDQNREFIQTTLEPTVKNSQGKVHFDFWRQKFHLFFTYISPFSEVYRLTKKPPEIQSLFFSCILRHIE